MKMVNRVGMRYGRLTVVEFYGRRRNAKGITSVLWLCKCDCGNTAVVSSGSLANGSVTSCGCFKSEYVTAKNTTHGESRTKLYNVWSSMKDRCYRPSCAGYKNYGGRGISLCEQWKDDFKAFHDWAYANGYAEGLTIERIDNNGNYQPDNCIFIPKSQQSRNRRNCHYITFRGETKTLSEWCREFHIDRATLRKHEERLGNGSLALEEALKRKHII